MNNKDKAGCLCGVAQLFIIQPMWFALLWVLLTGVGAPTWAWGIYWAYVPVCVLVGLATAFVTTLDD